MQKDFSTQDIRYLKGVGPKRAAILNSIGIASIEDALYYFPRGYEDRTKINTIADLRLGEYQTVKAKVLRFYERRSLKQSRLRILEALVEDESGRISCVWFNRPYLRKYIQPDKQLLLYGRIEPYGKRLQMQNPDYEITRENERKDSLNYARIVPVYPLTDRLSQRGFRSLIKSIIDKYLPVLGDILPYDIRKRHNLLNIVSSILNMHFPQTAPLQGLAYKRIIFEECFLLQLLFGLKRLKGNRTRGISHRLNEEFLGQFIKSLPFNLTGAQTRVLEAIRKDMASANIMHRLLQGDVGSGKTVVALYACLIAVSNGYQAAFMAPTEILAHQHYQNIKDSLTKIRCQGRLLKVGLLTSSLKKKDKEKLLSEAAAARIDILVGTHALIQDDVSFKSLGLAVIDEQHKFGVHQRLGILAKSNNPDCLIMTATPIPRTLARVIYADMDVSILDELPPGRIAVKTYFIDEGRRQWAYDLLRGELKAGRQGYIVYPIIDESDTLDLNSASLMYENLKELVFKEYKVGLIHGRLKQKERVNIMRGFKDADIKLLVSTVMIEAGIDIANASVMIVEHADRFGLSQLHQLRGRIGRGSHESCCILISDAKTEESSLRLEAMVNETDGFKIAQRDLELRGPGEFFGVRQHGMPELRVNPLENLEQLRLAREEARKLLQADPNLSSRQNQGLANVLRRRFPDYERLCLS